MMMKKLILLKAVLFFAFKINQDDQQCRLFCTYIILHFIFFSNSCQQATNQSIEMLILFVQFQRTEPLT